MFKPLQFFAAGFLLFSGLSLQAQTLHEAGKLDGSNITKTHVERMVQGPFDQNVLIGSYSDSLHLDISFGGYTLTGGGPGAKNAFLASYSPFGNVNFGISLYGSSASDSAVIRSVYVDYSDNIYIGGSLYGTVDFDGFSGTTNLSSTSGADAFLAKYDASGNLIWADQFITTGTTGSINSITLTGGGYLYVAGNFSVDIDTDPTGAPAITPAVGGIDAFIGIYDPTTGGLFTCSMLGGSGNENIKSIYTDYLDNVYFVGNFDTDVDMDPTATSVTYTNSAGGSDAFIGIWTSSMTYLNSIQLQSSSGNIVPVDMFSDSDYPAVLFDFTGSFDMNPLNPGIDIATTAGGTDVALCSFDGSLVLNWGKTFGNAGENHGHIIEREMGGSGGSRSSWYMYLFTMNFSGTLDVDPNAGVLNITATNTAVNAVGITIDDMGNYTTHFTNEAHTIVGIAHNSNDQNDMTVAGDFKGTNVDIAPTAAISQQTHTTNFAGYYVFYNRCAIVADVTLDDSYECGTNTAVLNISTTGSLGEDYYWWSNGANDSSIVVSDGTYYCEVNDLFGCSSTDTIHIGHYGMPALGGTVTPVASSCGNNFGSATVVAVNALGTPSYAWSNGDYTNAADSLTAGFYTVNVYDTSGCYIVVPFNISDADGPSVSLVSASSPVCGGLSTGAIDVTVTGGAAPVTYQWSNGATTEDITGVVGGSYAIIATDVNGCVGQLCVTISQPDPLSIIQNDLWSATCLSSDGQIMIAPQGGTAPYTIQWDAATGFQTNDTVTGLFAGIYGVTITDAQGCTYSENYVMGNNDPWWSPYVYYAGETAESCAGGLGSTYVDVYGSGVFTYLWDNGATTEDLIGVPGGKHNLLVYDVNYGCYRGYTTYLYSLPPSIPDVCMVTVDSAALHNLVVYDETTTPEAVYYKIYREGFCDATGFTHIGTVDRDSLSVFTDTVVNSDTRSWKYYVTAVDSCGNESGPSVINKTIHLSIYFNASFDLVCNWDAYEGQPLSGYTVYRVNPTGTAFDSVTTVGPTTLGWTDMTDFSPWTGQLQYYVQGIPVSSCSPTRAFNQNSSRSNNASAFIIIDTTGSFIHDAVEMTETMSIYPNPANDRLNIRIDGGNSSGYKVEMLNQVGQTIQSMSMFSAVSGMSTQGLEEGVYFVRITSLKEGRNKTFKLVISR